ncbi:protein STPG4 [Chelydra serpentina]|uniref:Protein STPG4 n=1 Tax=Chelydra serpentina TaxID=8475 RepID=A0A8T1S798_CHESE|nr:protein STPG4 [Chelydra serpentina]
MKGKSPHPVSSCFQSKVPRLQPVRSKIPGPGAYEPTRQFPKQPRTIASLGHEHSIFFSNTFGF